MVSAGLGQTKGFGSAFCFRMSARPPFPRVERDRRLLARVPHLCVVDTSLSGTRVVLELEALMARRGKPLMIVSDNDTELVSHAVLRFISHAVLRFSGATRIEWHYIAPGEPVRSGPTHGWTKLMTGRKTGSTSVAVLETSALNHGLLNL